MVLICISLVTLKCLLDNCVFLSVTHMFKSFAHLSTVLFEVFKKHIFIYFFEGGEGERKRMKETSM